MKRIVEIDEKLWREFRKTDAFPSDEAALQHILITAFYHGDPNNISTKLILVTGKVKVTKLDDPQVP